MLVATFTNKSVGSFPVSTSPNIQIQFNTVAKCCLQWSKSLLRNTKQRKVQSKVITCWHQSKHFTFRHWHGNHASPGPIHVGDRKQVAALMMEACIILPACHLQLFICLMFGCSRADKAFTCGPENFCERCLRKQWEKASAWILNHVWIRNCLASLFFLY